MAFKIKKRPVDAVIPTASTADIAFLLIIFFMVTTTFQVDRTQIPLPKTSKRDEVVRGSAYIVLERNGTIRFTAGKDTSFLVADMEDLSGYIAEVTGTNVDHPFVIKADESLNYREIDQLLEILKDAYAKNVYFLSDQKTIEGS
jgi:biopolymer transport protein ExbD